MFYLVAHGGEAFHPAMRHFPVAFPAEAVGAVLMMVGYKSGCFGIRNLVGMAADAVLLHYLGRGL